MLDRLFSPLTINGKTLKNRCVVTPMLMNFCEEDGTCTERFAAYHEAKAKGAKAEDLYQLRLYTDGYSMDGMLPRESILIGERHPKEVESLMEQLNTQCDPTGLPYHFSLRTWREEGITA